MPIFPALVVAGQLRRQYLLPPQGRPLVDAPGGNLLYAAAGIRLWQDDALGMLARVGEDYPQEWLRTFQKSGFDPQGIRILPEALDLRTFLAYTDLQTSQRTNPVSHFARLGLPFPKSLLGYQPAADDYDSRARQNPDSPRLMDIPETYRQAKAFHLCPLDFITHLQLSTAFRQFGATTISIDPGPSYMNGNFLVDLRSLLQGMTAFLPSEDEIRALFWGRTNDLWEMAATLGSFGCEIIVIKRGGRGQFLYEASTGRKWEIPAYPTQPADPTGAGDAFCGGFLSGYAESHNPLESCLRGGIAASLSIEGSGPFYVFDAMPGLAQARLLSLTNLVKEVT
jgi:sugar/nucleoside kinase (ribokinase family)